MNVEFVIAVTDGIRRITSYKHRPNVPIATVFASGDYQPLPMTEQFDRLIGQHGPLHLANLADGSAHEMKIDKRFETGRSWEFPVSLHHGFRFTQVEAGLDEKWVIWSTGAVDNELDIDQSQSYHIKDKLENSKDFLLRQKRAGYQVLLLIPAHERDKLEHQTLQTLEQAGILVRPTSNVLNALELIAELLSPQKDRNAVQPLSEKPSLSGSVLRIALLILGSIGLLGIGLAASPYARNLFETTTSENPAPPVQVEKSTAEPPVDGPSPVEADAETTTSPPENSGAQVKMFLIQSTPDHSCIWQISRPDNAFATPLDAKDGRYSMTAEKTLCGMAIKNSSPANTIQINLPANLTKQLMHSIEGNLSILPNETRRLFFKRHANPIGEYLAEIKIKSADKPGQTIGNNEEISIHFEKFGKL